jgi:radical SAM superfamily enzyme YgiQ (UPF0313 family)
LRIAFIHPHLTGPGAKDAMEPLALAVLKGMTPQDVEVVLYDDRREAVPKELNCDLVAISVETYTASRAYQLAAQYRAQGIRVVLGGHHPTLAPQEAAEHADSVLVGDAEGVWAQLVADARLGKLQPRYQQTPGRRPAWTIPDRTLFQRKAYAPVALIQYGRGCRFACDFCSVHAYYGRSLKFRPLASVMDEIAGLSTRYLFFIDDNLFSSRTHALALCRALKPMRRRWACQISIDAAEDEELLDAMAESGCAVAVMGFESLNPRNLEIMHKRANLRGQNYATVVRRFHKRGIMIYGTFIFGYDHDTPASFKATLEFALESNLFLANFNPLTPMPGTALYDRLKKERRLRYDRWWLAKDYRYGQAVFMPKSMSTADLTEGCWLARQEFNRWPAIAKRVWAWRNHTRDLSQMLLFLGANWVSRREIFRKQGGVLRGENKEAT